LKFNGDVANNILDDIALPEIDFGLIKTCGYQKFAKVEKSHFGGIGEEPRGRGGRGIRDSQNVRLVDLYNFPHHFHQTLSMVGLGNLKNWHFREKKRKSSHF
jgi:hypothetical protein